MPRRMGYAISHVAKVEGTILPFVIVNDAITSFVIVIIIAMTAGLHEPSAMVAKIEDVMNDNNSVKNNVMMAVSMYKWKSIMPFSGLKVVFPIFSHVMKLG